MKYACSQFAYIRDRSISILIFTILVFATIDTHLFVYPSLSRTLISEVLVLLLSAMTLIYCIAKKINFICTKYDCFIFTWIAFIAIHYIYCHPHEQYRTIYLAVTLLLIPAVSVFLRHGCISRKRCEDFLLVIAAVHIIYILAQRAEIIDSGNKYFTLTGASENPTVTALYLVGCIPFVAERAINGNKKIYYDLFLCACIIAILILGCRTAYIGLGIELSVGMACWSGKKNIKLSRLQKYIIIL